jgi:hypothetical protein
MQVEAIKHQGSRPGEEDKDARKRSTQVVGDCNGMNYKQVQRYIRLTELVPDLQAMVLSRVVVPTTSFFTVIAALSTYRTHSSSSYKNIE